MFWKRIMRKIYQRDNSIRKSSISQTNLNSKPLGAVGCGDESLLGKQKMDFEGIESFSHRVRKKPRLSEKNELDNITCHVDRISELPEPTIHHIFSFLRCHKDVVRTCILSKRWNNMFKSYMTFDFDQRHFRVRLGKGKHNRLKARELQKTKFKTYVEKAMASRLGLVPSIDKFRLYVSNLDDGLEVCLVHWIHRVVEKNVKELDIHANAKGKLHVFLHDVLVSKSLTSLKLSGPVWSMLFYLKMCNLRELSIKNAFINIFIVRKIEQCCPLIEDLRLISCTGLWCLVVSGLVKLRRVEVHECRGLKLIDIDAPNLETFWYHAMTNRHCGFNLIGCGELKNLSLKDCKMTDTEFQDCISKCPLIEKLTLMECNSLERLTILSGKLKSLVLMQCRKLREINVDAPNLFNFQYSGHVVPLSSMNLLGLCEAKFFFSHRVNMRAAMECQKFFRNLDWSKGFKLVVHSKQIMKIYECLTEPDLQNYFRKVDATISSTGVLKIIDDWLRECHGRTLVLVSPSSELLKLIHTMIMNRDDKPNCCGFNSKKCWQHYLVDVKMMNMGSAETQFYGFKWRNRRRPMQLA